MTPVFVAADNIISSLGFTTSDNWGNVKKGISGIELHNNKFNKADAVFASLIDSNKLDDTFTEAFKTDQRYTKFEKIVILSISKALENLSVEVTSNRTLIILSSTKGNIDLLANPIQGIDRQRVGLAETAQVIQRHFQNPNTPLVISNACISGVLALLIGKRLIDSSQYDNVIVVGADIVSDFVVAGFQSLKALANEPCRPYDVNRTGLNLGEGAATIVLSSDKKVLNQKRPIYLLSGATSNDANHISGPSRDGEGLYQTIKSALNSGGIESVSGIDYISAHGTATLFNDEMESQALSRLELSDVPVNSLKGYFGHTLGAAGLIESVIAVNSIKENLLVKSHGFKQLGVTQKINVIEENIKIPMTNCLKIASGFGGCNAGILFAEK